MPPPAVEVRAPSRLHFGMFSFGQPGVRQFGGVGVMVDAPGLHVRVSAADRLSATGPMAERATDLVRRVAAHLRIEPHFQVEVLHSPRPHVGLGTGTQLGMSIAAALFALADRPTPTAEELARACGRGLRSAIGVHGFCHGGLIIEAGKLQSDEISPLIERVELPSDWRFVLIIPRADAGLHGDAERTAFDRLPPVESSVTSELKRIALQELVPAAKQADFDRFRDALEEFNREAGQCFAAVQGGPYSAQAQHVVDQLKSIDVHGYAQTSWGPAVCVPYTLSSDAAFQSIRNHWHDSSDVDMINTEPANTGAWVTRIA